MRWFCAHKQAVTGYGSFFFFFFGGISAVSGKVQHLPRDSPHFHCLSVKLCKKKCDGFKVSLQNKNDRNGKKKILPLLLSLAPLGATVFLFFFPCESGLCDAIPNCRLPIKPSFFFFYWPGTLSRMRSQSIVIYRHLIEK